MKFPLTNDNYNLTWETLLGRYNNPRVLFTHCMQLFYSQPIVAKEDSTKLKHLIDTSGSCFSTLRNLKVDVDACDQVFVHFLISKLSMETHQFWEQELGNSKEIPTFKRFCDFIEVRYRTLESLELKSNNSDSKSAAQQRLSSPSQPTQRLKFRRDSRVNHISSSIDSKGISCILCKESHITRRCHKFLAMDCFARKTIVDTNRLCINCLSSTHLVSTCPSNRNCQQCGKRAHTLLHFPQTINNPSSFSHTAATSSTTPSHRRTISTNNIGSEIGPLLFNAIKFTSKTNVLLPTAVVKVTRHDSSTVLLRTLIEQGSTGALVSERAADTLKLEGWPTKTSIKLTNGQQTSGRYITQFTIKSRIAANFQLDVTASVVKNVTENLPVTTISYHDWPHLRDLKLADPEFYRSLPVDLLIGSDLFSDLIMEELRKGRSDEPIAHQTAFGWTISGKAISISTPYKYSSTTNCSHICLEDLDVLVKKFYALESIPTEEQHTPEEIWCQEYYCRTTIRQANGKYLVRLPLKTHFDSNLTLGKTRQNALNRFYLLERKFNNNIKVQDQYTATIKEYFDLNQITPVQTNEEQHLQLYNNQPSYSCCTLPHHAMMKEDSLTTKCRVVFDASARSSSGKSLNNILCSGPRLLNELPAVLLNWRLHVYVITADIEKMFRCIDTQEEDSE
ncbi:uncharacterized protein [Eurosta solidaginis]|uniref:uncharacterized protein n=1 Tax=Eurosta solidaginis TaxID=178769 RepID=UPI0035305FAC